MSVVCLLKSWTHIQRHPTEQLTSSKCQGKEREEKTKELFQIEGDQRDKQTYESVRDPGSIKGIMEIPDKIRMGSID